MTKPDPQAQPVPAADAQEAQPKPLSDVATSEDIEWHCWSSCRNHQLGLALNPSDKPCGNCLLCIAAATIGALRSTLARLQEPDDAMLIAAARAIGEQIRSDGGKERRAECLRAAIKAAAQAAQKEQR